MYKIMSIQDAKILVTTISQQVESGLRDNFQRLEIYARLEILHLDLQSLLKPNLRDEIELNDLLLTIDNLTKKLNLVPRSEEKGIIAQIDYLTRFLGFSLGFVISGTIGALVLLLCRVIDSSFSVPQSQSYTDLVRRSMAKFFLMVSGVEITIEGITDKTFESNAHILSFAHGSNFDGFLVCATCPTGLVAFAKKELFMVPFFSWMSLALGGIPVDRENRERAIATLHRSVEDCQHKKISLAIAPEGTRSITGQLLPFKKGTFHMWEELRAPIIPVIFFGSYDLWPVKRWINNTGNILVRYLDPIMPNEASNRDDMLNLVRRKMLLSIANCPTSISKPLSFSGHISSIIARSISLWAVYSCYTIALRIMKVFGMSTWRFLFLFTLTSIMITAALYIYYVYIVNLTTFNKFLVDSHKNS